MSDFEMIQSYLLWKSKNIEHQVEDSLPDEIYLQISQRTGLPDLSLEPVSDWIASVAQLSEFERKNVNMSLKAIQARVRFRTRSAK